MSSQTACVITDFMEVLFPAFGSVEVIQNSANILLYKDNLYESKEWSFAFLNTQNNAIKISASKNYLHGLV